MSEISAKKFGYLVNVTTDELGRPHCPHCQDPMVEVQPGEFACPDWAFVFQLTAEMASKLSAEFEERVLGGPAHMTGLAQFASQGLGPSLWPLESGLQVQRHGEKRTVSRDAFAAPVDWDAALRTPIPAGGLA